MYIGGEFHVSNYLIDQNDVTVKKKCAPQIVNYVWRETENIFGFFVLYLYCVRFVGWLDVVEFWRDNIFGWGWVTLLDIRGGLNYQLKTIILGNW